MFWNQRRKNIITVYCILGSVGGLYLLWFAITGFGIPCYFREIFGKPCSLCGGSRMLLSFAKGDFAAAFSYHPVMAVLIPFWTALSALLFWGNPKFLLKPWVLYTLLGLSVVCLLAFGVIRRTLG